jgi:hypothetical protein
MCAAIQYLTRKTNELFEVRMNALFEARMQYAAQKICERQSLFHNRAA